MFAGVFMPQPAMLTALKTLPLRRDVMEALGLVLLFCLVASLLGTHLIDLSRVPTAAEMVKVSAVAFVVPALVEEVVFRGWVIRRFRMWDAIASVTLYVLWHPLEALTFLPEARAVFFDPVFLLLVALLGVLCAIAYFRSRSIWPSVIIHWLVVVAWKGLGGAGFVL